MAPFNEACMQQRAVFCERLHYVKGLYPVKFLLCERAVFIKGCMLRYIGCRRYWNTRLTLWRLRVSCPGDSSSSTTSAIDSRWRRTLSAHSRRWHMSWRRRWWLGRGSCASSIPSDHVLFSLLMMRWTSSGGTAPSRRLFAPLWSYVGWQWGISALWYVRCGPQSSGVNPSFSVLC